jgi:hypothetical protein
MPQAAGFAVSNDRGLNIRFQSGIAFKDGFLDVAVRIPGDPERRFQSIMNTPYSAKTQASDPNNIDGPLRALGRSAAAAQQSFFGRQKASYKRLETTSKSSDPLGGVSIVTMEHSAETLSTSDGTVGPARFRCRADELVV